MTIRITIACSFRSNFGLDIISGNFFKKKESEFFV